MVVRSKEEEMNWFFTMEYRTTKLKEMRSETTKRILSETPQEVKDTVSEITRLKSEIREFKLLVREYFQHRAKIAYSGMNAAMEWVDKKNDLENRILSELEAFTRRDVAELPFGSEEDILP